MVWSSPSDIGQTQSLIGLNRINREGILMFAISIVPRSILLLGAILIPTPSAPHVRSWNQSEIFAGTTPVLGANDKRREWLFDLLIPGFIGVALVVSERTFQRFACSSATQLKSDFGRRRNRQTLRETFDLDCFSYPKRRDHPIDRSLRIPPPIQPARRIQLREPVGRFDAEKTRVSIEVDPSLAHDIQVESASR
jgi:hypothetical protein